MRMPRVVVALAIVSDVACAGAANFLYAPPNDATAPYYWSTVANWAYVNSTKATSAPTERPGSLPTASDKVYVSDRLKLPSDPLCVVAGDTISVSELHIASSGGYGEGKGTKFEMSGGTLSVASNASFFNGDNAYGAVSLTGGTLTIGGKATIGYNPTTTYPATFVVGQGATLNVAGQCDVGRRSTKYGMFVTNAGEVVVGSLVIGPYGDSKFQGTGVVHNVGTLRSNGNVTIGSASSAAADARLVLAANSVFSFGASSSLTTAGSLGTQLFDTAVDIVCGEGQTVQFDGKNSVARFRGNARFVANSTGNLFAAETLSGSTCKVELLDDAAIVLTNELRFANASLATGVLVMHGRSVVSNLNTMRCGATTGSRKASRLEIEMDGDSAIHFRTNAPSRSLALGTTVGSSARVVMRERSRIDGIRNIYYVTDYATNSASVRLEGGTVAFIPKSATSAESGFLLGSAKNVAGCMSLSGYGTMTREDIASPNNSLTMGFLMRGPEWYVTADGMGAERTLDLRAFGDTVSNGYLANRSGTNGWHAVNGGKLVFPRQSKYFGRSDTNPVRFVGEYAAPGMDPESGEPRLPTHVNAFSYEATGVNGSVGYAYGELYAPDRTDYPSLASYTGAGAVVMSVWRVGTDTATWTRDEPSSHASFTSVKMTFRYDVDAVPRDGKERSLVLYRHTGAADGRWKRVGVVDAAEALSAKTVSTGYLEPSGETWDIGWFALVAREKSGLIIEFR